MTRQYSLLDKWCNYTDYIEPILRISEKTIVVSSLKCCSEILEEPLISLVLVTWQLCLDLVLTDVSYSRTADVAKKPCSNLIKGKIWQSKALSFEAFARFLFVSAARSLSRLFQDCSASEPSARYFASTKKSKSWHRPTTTKPTSMTASSR